MPLLTQELVCNELGFEVTLSSHKTDCSYKIGFCGIARKHQEKLGEFAFQVDRKRGELFISELYIEKRNRGKGLGNNILIFIESLATSLGLQRVILDPCPIDASSFDDESLRSWYNAHGYKMCKGIFKLNSEFLAKTLPG
jgi:GNAT superfamily N-acetyltransferase